MLYDFIRMKESNDCARIKLDFFKPSCILYCVDVKGFCESPQDLVDTVLANRRTKLVMLLSVGAEIIDILHTCYYLSFGSSHENCHFEMNLFKSWTLHMQTPLQVFGKWLHDFLFFFMTGPVELDFF